MYEALTPASEYGTTVERLALRSLEHHPDQVPVSERRLDYDCFAVETLTPHIGAEIRGLDLSVSLSNAQGKELHRALHDWMVLVFPDQELTAEQHKAFGEHYARLHVHSQLRASWRRFVPEFRSG